MGRRLWRGSSQAPFTAATGTYFYCPCEEFRRAPRRTCSPCSPVRRIRACQKGPHSGKGNGTSPVQKPFREDPLDRKSTRLNSSHLVISYAVFCFQKQNRPGRPVSSAR